MISEIAELSVESENIANVMGLQREDFYVEPPKEIKAATEAKTARMPRVRWSSLKFDGDASTKSSWGMMDDDDDDGGEPSQTDSDHAEGDRIGKEEYFDSSSRLPIKDLLDKWEEPLSKRDQVIPANSYSLQVHCLNRHGGCLTIECLGSYWALVAQCHCQRYLKVSKGAHLHGSGLSLLRSVRACIKEG